MTEFPFLLKRIAGDRLALVSPDQHIGGRNSAILNANRDWIDIVWKLLKEAGVGEYVAEPEPPLDVAAAEAAVRRLIADNEDWMKEMADK